MEHIVPLTAQHLKTQSALLTACKEVEGIMTVYAVLRIMVNGNANVHHEPTILRQNLRPNRKLQVSICQRLRLVYPSFNKNQAKLQDGTLPSCAG